MTHFVGLDVSLEETSICLVDDQGQVVCAAKVVSEPAAIIAVLRGLGAKLTLVGLEAGVLSPWLHAAVRAAGQPVACLETRQVKAALGAMRNKTDGKDAWASRRSCARTGFKRLTSRAARARSCGYC
jgi:transposase